MPAKKETAKSTFSDDVKKAVKAAKPKAAAKPAAKKPAGKRGADKKPRAAMKPRTSNKPKTPGSKVIVKATDELTDDILDNDDGDVVSIMPCDGLTPRQILFVENYMRTFNARLSMQLAGYEGSAETLCATGSRMLRFAKVAKLITFYMESHAMPKTELAAWNARIARGSMGSFLRIEDDALGRPTARLDLASPEAIANHDLIKEWDGKEIDKIVSEGDGGPESALLINQAHIKMYDKQKSLDAISKTYEKLPPEPPDQSPQGNNFTLNGHMIVTTEATMEFMSKALGVPVEQIPTSLTDEDRAAARNRK